MTCTIEQKKSPNLRELAVAAGVSIASVSRALGGKSKVTAEKRLEIQAIARKMGYQPNLHVGQMMSSIRSRRGQTFRGNIALVWWEDSVAKRSDRRIADIRQGAVQRAGELGYHLDEFDVCDHSPLSLRRIIDSRGICGILVFSPSFSGSKTWSMPLNDLACVSLGWGLWEPTLDVVRFNYFEAMRLALHHASLIFHGKIAAIWDFQTDQTAHNSVRGCFFANHPAGPGTAGKLFFDHKKITPKLMAEAVHKHSIECVILHSTFVPPGWLGDLIPEKNWIWSRDSGTSEFFGRIDPQNNVLGRWAVNLLNSKVQANDGGVPTDRQTLLVPPRWISGNSGVLAGAERNLEP